MKIISLISTVLNEEDSIKDFMESILNQTLLPDEIIIVDGGSEDKTYEILKEYEKKYDFVKIIQEKGANVAKGRNVAIKNSSGIIIVTSDAGCKYDREYVREITKSLLKYILNHLDKFNIKKEDFVKYLNNKGINIEELKDIKEGEFVQGVTYTMKDSRFEKFAGYMLIKDPEKQNKVPSRISSRASAYFKYVWEKIGGYPEIFVTGEDTKFHLEVLNRDYKFVFDKNAKVYWKVPRNIKEFYRKFEKYAIGDVLQGNILKYKKLLIFFLGFWLLILILVFSAIFLIKLFILVLSLIILYLLYLGIKYYIKSKDFLGIIYIPILELTKRLAYQTGFIKGFIK
ncbi:glycosyl transferase family 2 [Nanobdella aerobiophila]|uniref:Glycosyl transferase family 2 n=1 Tax=Nanobdella aerobiophila TaxID=2586965 RepID=A0A915WRC9_9ARCH|nr:glycosyltransferase [Nanobdella aerobiophila]BBL45438.1 glycosyl transferase family 2 [Nanobdella aerobiophila]